jgi:hypothetical protein
MANKLEYANRGPRTMYASERNALCLFANVHAPVAKAKFSSMGDCRMGDFTQMVHSDRVLSPVSSTCLGIS